VEDLNGLETVLLSDTSKITQLDIDRSVLRAPMMGLTPVLRALARRPALTELGLRRCPLGRDEARLLRLALCNIPSLQGLALTHNTQYSRERRVGGTCSSVVPQHVHQSAKYIMEWFERYGVR
jgi:hypothetical protein